MSLVTATKEILSSCGCHVSILDGISLQKGECNFPFVREEFHHIMLEIGRFQPNLRLMSRLPSNITQVIDSRYDSSKTSIITSESSDVADNGDGLPVAWAQVWDMAVDQ